MQRSKEDCVQGGQGGLPADEVRAPRPHSPKHRSKAARPYTSGKKEIERDTKRVRSKHIFFTKAFHI